MNLDLCLGRLRVAAREHGTEIWTVCTEDELVRRHLFLPYLQYNVRELSVEPQVIERCERLVAVSAADELDGGGRGFYGCGNGCW